MNRLMTLLMKLHHTKLLTVAGVLHLLMALVTNGVNLMAIVALAAKLHPHRTALVDEKERLSYVALWRQAEALAIALHLDYHLHPRQKVAIVCRNHGAAIKALFALSRLGTHIFLINPEQSADQLLALADRWQFDFYVYDPNLASVFTQPHLQDRALPTDHPTQPSIDRLSSPTSQPKTRLKKMKTGNLVVMTGGTTGQPKAASRKPSILNFLPPFVALLCDVHLDRYRSLYIATPIYHGFGLAALLIGILLGAELHMTQRFDANRACALIEQNRVEVITLVPLMLQRMLTLNPNALTRLQCIITGGAALNPSLAEAVLDRLGPKLFNLYGTSEAGVCIMATPDRLQRKPASIGQPLLGVQVKIKGMENANSQLDPRLLQEAGDLNQIGHLCIRSAWTIHRDRWIETGDLAYRDGDGDIVLCGRVDDMIVSGGENVYPIELENILIQHPAVDSVAVVGIVDREFGQRLKAVVVKKPDTVLDEPSLIDWLKPRTARHQMPKVIEFREQLPYTTLGKLDRRSLL